MSGFDVTPDELTALDGFVAAQSAPVRAAVERLTAEAGALFADGWHGPAAAAFRLAWEQWLAGARAVLQAMDELAALVGSAGGGYADTDDAVRVAFARGAA